MAHEQKPSQKRRSRALLRVFSVFLPILLFSGILGTGLEQAWAQLPQEPLSVATALEASGDDLERPAGIEPGITLASLDVVPEDLQLGQSVYLRECATCHIAPSPAVLPTQTWATLLVSAQHYGTQIEVIGRPAIDLVWDYIQFASRPILENETPPDRIRNSRFFRALHPRVEIERIDLASCAGCHPNAWDYDYRTLNQEWLDAP
ncbi:MAG: diheme cytochrome C [Cyanobacteria bacterium J06638_22]